MRNNLDLVLLSPLMHFSDERLGTMQIARTLKFEYEGEFLEIPVFSGNALRGQLRRLAMSEYLDRIGISDEGISLKLYYLLFTGGALTGGSRFTEIGQKREMRKMCPPLSLFGSAIGDQIPEGKLKVGILKPVCKETAAYTGIESELSIYDMIGETFYVRSDSLKYTNSNININDEEKHKNPVQMKYEMQGLSIGTRLTGYLCIENSNEVEEACLNSIMDRFKEKPFIGGKSGTGHGEVKIDWKNSNDVNIYYDYLEENKEEMKKWLKDIEEKL